jgi:hypothetical protein
MSYDLDKDLRRILPYSLYLKLISPRQLLFDFYFSNSGPSGPVPLTIQQIYKSKTSYTESS